MFYCKSIELGKRLVLSDSILSILLEIKINVVCIMSIDEFTIIDGKCR